MNSKKYRVRNFRVNSGDCKGHHALYCWGVQGGSKASPLQVKISKNLLFREVNRMNLVINDEERNFLLNIVECALRAAVMEKRRFGEGDLAVIPEGILQERMGAFVTYSLNRNGRGGGHKELRGCIGIMQAEYPLWVTVASMAYSAALEDTRFLPISEEELVQIDFDITVLGPFSVCCDKEKIVLGKHGVMLEAHGRTAVFLPQVAIEQGWNLHETFEHLCQKVGLPIDTWQEKETVFYWYEGLMLHGNRV